MTHLIRAANRHDAWHQGVTYLLSNPDDVNVILDIEDPMHEPAEGHDARNRIDAYYEQRDRPSTHSIAELIFPGAE
ncbi:MAG: hypothetical protein LC623_04045, partial [Halobacteriales archaeon]|nr:hypothetical protein [Halobacteriales archaeon]